MSERCIAPPKKTLLIKGLLDGVVSALAEGRIAMCVAAVGASREAASIYNEHGMYNERIIARSSYRDPCVRSSRTGRDRAWVTAVQRESQSVCGAESHAPPRCASRF